MQYIVQNKKITIKYTNKYFIYLNEKNIFTREDALSSNKSRRRKNKDKMN